MELVFLESGNLGDDIDLSFFSDFGNVTVYEQTPLSLLKERIGNADIIILNKLPMTEEYLCDACNLKLICITATGTNNVDFEYTKKRGIEVKNAEGYSTQAVVQHTFAMAFYLMEHLAFYDDYVKSGEYIKSSSFTYFERKFEQLANMTWGIAGLGAIGLGVARIAREFGARVIYYSTSGNNHRSEWEEVDFDTLLSESDVLSVHAPLNEKTKGMFNLAAFNKMKSSAVFLNLGRGPIVVEHDLKTVLKNGIIAAAGLDVLETEPMRADNPLFEIKDSDRLLITPHLAWAAVSARKKLMEMVYKNIEEFVSVDSNSYQATILE